MNVQRKQSSKSVISARVRIEQVRLERRRRRLGSSDKGERRDVLSLHVHLSSNSFVTDIEAIPGVKILSVFDNIVSLRCPETTLSLLQQKPFVNLIEMADKAYLYQ